MIYRNRMIVWPALIALFAVAFVPRLQARTWTSRSGATIEAELIKVAGGFVELESAEGKRFKIRPANLSEEDRQYIEERKVGGEEARQLTEDEIAAQFGADAVEKKNNAAEKKPAPAAKEGGQKKDEAKSEHFLDAANFAKPEPLKVADFPGLELRNPEKATFLGLQYGPGAKDVVYAAFDRETVTDLPEVAFIHNMRKTRMNINSYKRAGKKGNFEIEEKKQEYRVARFEDIPLESSFGDVKLNADLQFIFGILNPNTLHGLVEVELQKGFQKCDFVLIRDLSAHLTASSGEIKTLPLLGIPSLNVKVLWNNIYGSLNLDDWTMIPDDEVELKIMDSEGKEVEDADIEWEENAVIGNTRKEWKWYDPEEFEAPGNYKVRARIDLGPILGSVSNDVAHTVGK